MKFFNPSKKQTPEIPLLAITQSNSELHEISINKEELKIENFLKVASSRIPKAVFGRILQFLDTYELANLGLSPFGEHLLLGYINQRELKIVIATGFAPLTLNKIQNHIDSGLTVYEHDHPYKTKLLTLFWRAFFILAYVGLGIGFPVFLVYAFLFSGHPGNKNNEPATENYLYLFIFTVLWWLGICIGACLAYGMVASERKEEILKDNALGIIISKDDHRIKAVCDYVGIYDKTVAEFQTQVQDLQVSAPNFPTFFRTEQIQTVSAETPQIQL